MRRKDREITDPGRIAEIMDDCACCRIGFNDNGQIYIVPLNFGYRKKNGRYVFYFHGAGEGRKIGLIRQNPQVGFEMDTGYCLHTADTACGHSARFQSIIGNGTVSLADGAEEKKDGLLAVMEHATGRSDWEFTENMTEKVCVFKLEVESMSCKEHA